MGPVDGSISTASAHVDGPAPEGVIARDMLKRVVFVAPALVLVFGLMFGLNGALSAAYGVAIVVINFVLAAVMLVYAGRISASLMMFAALFGYLIRLTLIFLAIWLVRDASWVELVPLGITIVVTHLGLLLWEMKYVSASLAFPALKPGPVSKESSSQ